MPLDIPPHALPPDPTARLTAAVDQMDARVHVLAIQHQVVVAQQNTILAKLDALLVALATVGVATIAAAARPGGQTNG